MYNICFRSGEILRLAILVRIFFIRKYLDLFFEIYFLSRNSVILVSFIEQPYLELVNSYSTGRISELETFVQANKDKFESVSCVGTVLKLFTQPFIMLD